MKILVANLGSTSFKYRLLDMETETQLARGGIERIGSPGSRCAVEIGGRKIEKTLSVPDHSEAVRQCLAQLTDPEHGCLSDPGEVSAIGFKAVHGGRYSGVQRVTPELLDAMEELNPLAPAHNPAYCAAMRQLNEQFPELPLVAAFETGFHQTIPERQRLYAVPLEWADEYLVKRWGFHGASHRYISVRTAELLGRSDLRIISCHLGGSSSLSAIRDGTSVANSFGTSPQSGLPHNNRAGDFDPFGIPLIMKKTGKSLDEVLEMLGSQGGLLGLSGRSGDLRDVSEAAAAGDQRCELALDVFATAVRNYLGAHMVEMAGVDVLVFTGGIGENQPGFRAKVCENLQCFGIVLDPQVNDEARGEMKISAAESKTQIWVIPTNEEIIVARQTKALLEES